MSRRHATSRPIILIALAMLTFLPFLGRRDIVTSHEARVVQTSRQMAISGWPWNARRIVVPQSELRQTPEGERLLPRADGATMSVNPWIVPIMNGQVRLQKPPLPYWCTAIVYRMIGESEFSSRVIPALLGAIAVLLVWDVARILLGNVAAWYAGLIWISSYFIVDEFRKSMADPYLAFFVLMAVWSWVRAGTAERMKDEGRRMKNETSSVTPASSPVLEALENQIPLPSMPTHTGEDARVTHYVSSSSLKRRWSILFYLALAMGTLSKGPIIFLFVPIIVAAIWACYPKLRVNRLSTRSAFVHLLGILLFILITTPWAIAVIRSVPNAIELWRYESIGALSDKSENARPWWFYLPNVFQITLPWTPLWIMGMILPFKFPKRRRLFLLLSVAVPVLVFSCSYAKKNAYLLPLMFINVMIVAEALRWLTLIPRRRPVRVAIFRTTVVALAFSIAVQVLVSAILPAIDNARSPRNAVRFAAQIAESSGGEDSLLYSRLPDEATVYLPLNVSESSTAKRFIMIADERRSGAALATAQRIGSTPGGEVNAVREIPFTDPTGKRWKIFRLDVKR
jgi:4-amino-4-deoxy-L-arabinose transferase-like glycosyltransferase